MVRTIADMSRELGISKQALNKHVQLGHIKTVRHPGAGFFHKGMHGIEDSEFDIIVAMRELRIPLASRIGRERLAADQEIIDKVLADRKKRLKS